MQGLPIQRRQRRGRTLREVAGARSVARAIGCIAQHGVADVRQMHADLVCAPCLQDQLDKARNGPAIGSLEDPHDPEMRHRATAVLAKPELVAPAPADGGPPTPLRQQPVTFAEVDTALDTPVYAGEDLAPGTTLAGPLIIVEPTTTLVIDPGATVRVTELGNYLIDLGEPFATGEAGR